MPSLPSSFGRHTLIHASLHQPPKTPAQMKARRSLSIVSSAHGERQRAMEVWIGMADIVALTSAMRPGAFSMSPFQPGILAATLSTSSCSSECFSL